MEEEDSSSSEEYVSADEGLEKSTEETGLSSDPGSPQEPSIAPESAQSSSEVSPFPNGCGGQSVTSDSSTPIPSSQSLSSTVDSPLPLNNQQTPSMSSHLPTENHHVPCQSYMPPLSDSKDTPPLSDIKDTPPLSNSKDTPHSKDSPPPLDNKDTPPPSDIHPQSDVPPLPSNMTTPTSSEVLATPPSPEGQSVPTISSELDMPPPHEDLPVPPPRRKRKKKTEKQPSLENLTEGGGGCGAAMVIPRSRTVSGSDVKKELSNSSPLASIPALPPNSSLNSPAHPSESIVNGKEGTDVVQNSCVSTRGQSSDNELGRTGSGVVLVTNVPLSNPLVRDTSSRSRSVTPTPTISIEPNVGLEWTADMLSLPESEVVTSETSLAKARGSTTTTSVAFPSDDESIDGDLVFADDTAEEEEEEEEEGGAESDGGEGDSDGGGPGDTSEKSTIRLHSPDSDNAILESTMVTNLDTGEVIPLSAAEERIPQGSGTNPLSEHLIQRTKEAEGVVYGDEGEASSQHRKSRKKTFSKLKWKRRRDKGVDAASTMRQADEAALSIEDHSIKYKPSSHKQTNQEFDKVRLKQDLTGIHVGAIWTMEFSICGRLLATAGQDGVVRVWVLTTAAVFFHELQSQYQRLGVHSSVDSLSEKASVASGSSKSSEEEDSLLRKCPFQEYPLCSYSGHSADILDLSWSKNFFLLSSSMDKTVRLWHISRKECLCCFQHVDFVTAIAFHPRDDRYFLSGSLDGKLRLWNIPDKRVALWNEIEGVGSHLITAANFCMNGKLAVVGTYDGRCIFYDTEHLKYHTQIHVKSRHGKNKGRKISGVEPLPGEDKLLVTSNDSRIRLYNLEDHALSCKYKGCINTSSQIKATFSRDGLYIISGSEDNFVYIWRTHLDLSKLSSARRDRNEFYESFSSHTAPVTTAVFAPVPGITVDEGIKEVGEMVVAADYQGSIKIYVSGEKL